MSTINHPSARTNPARQVKGWLPPGSSRLIQRAVFLALLIGCTILFFAPFLWLVNKGGFIKGVQSHAFLGGLPLLTYQISKAVYSVQVLQGVLLLLLLCSHVSSP